MLSCVRAAMIVAMLAVSAACGSEAPSEQASLTTAGTKAPLADSAVASPSTSHVSDAGATTGATNPVQVPSEALGYSVSMTFEDLPDVAHLAWRSNTIVRGVVVAEGVPQRMIANDPTRDPEIGNQDVDQIYTDYVVRVDAQLRGVVGDTLTIRRQGGTIDNITVINESEPELHVGNEAIFFVLAPARPYTGDFVVLTGGPQGVWWIRGSQAIPATSPSDEEGASAGGAMPVADLVAAIAAALAQPPPADMTSADGSPRYVSLEQSPPGVDLPR